jgi:Protein of unknown function (DUF3631)
MGKTLNAEAKAMNNVDSARLLDELAGLGGVAYEQRRVDAAKQLGMRTSVLDKAVKDKRRLVQKQSADLPYWTADPPPHSVDGNTLLQRVEARLRLHIAADDAIFTAATLWTAFSWSHDSFVHSPILLATSKEPNSGKTTLLELLKFMARRGLSTTEISAPALYRSIEKWQPTLIVDEADAIFRQNNELRAVFNSGWTRGSGVIRCNPDTLDPENFPTFGPKVIGMKGKKLPDTTLSRSIVLEMKRKRSGERISDFMHDDDAELLNLRGRLMRWAMDNRADLAKARPDVPQGFHNRLACNWRPLLAIADRCGGEWTNKARASARALSKQEPTSLYIQALTAIKTMFAEREKAPTFEERTRIFSQDIVDALVAIEDGPWKFFSGKDREKPITQNALARMLSPIAPTNIRIGTAQAKGYELHQFRDDFERYLGVDADLESCPQPPTPQNNPSQRPTCDGIRTSDNFKPYQPDSLGTDEKCEKPNNHAGWDVGTDGNGGLGLNSHLQAHDSPGRCAQCGGDEGAAPTLYRGADYPPEGVLLHRECLRFWLQDHHLGGQSNGGSGPPEDQTQQGMPFAMTRLMRERLRSAGYSADAIHNMTPGQAHEALTRSSAATTAPVRHAQNTDDIEF